jgi:hypothetical protein
MDTGFAAFAMLFELGLIFAWQTQRSGSGGYRVFRKMLDSGHPLEDWGTLLSSDHIEI